MLHGCQGKQLLYMSTNMTKINGGLIRINTWLDAKNELQTSLMMSKSFCAFDYHHVRMFHSAGSSADATDWGYWKRIGSYRSSRGS